MAQVPETVIQKALDAFHDANPDKFRRNLIESYDLPEYRIRQTATTCVEMLTPVITLVPETRFRVSFTLSGDISLATQLLALEIGGPSKTLPELLCTIRGTFVIELEGRYFTLGSDLKYLALDLKYFDIVEASISIDSPVITLSAELRNILASVARRGAITALRDGVVTIPIGFSIRPEVPFLAGLNIPAELNYKIVASGSTRVLAILMRTHNEPVVWADVSYDLADPNDVGVFIDFELIQMALDQVAIYLDDYDVDQPAGVDPSNPARHGSLTLKDSHFSVQEGQINVDNIEVHVRLLDTIQREIRETVCDFIFGACGLEQVCKDVLKFVMEEVLQLDQLVHIKGYLVPYVDAGKIKSDPNLEADYARWLWIFLPLTAGTVIPLAGIITPILMIGGWVWANRKLNGLAAEKEIDTVIDKPIPNTHLRVLAQARTLFWRPDNLAIMTRISFEPQ